MSTGKPEQAAAVHVPRSLPDDTVSAGSTLNSGELATLDGRGHRLVPTQATTAGLTSGPRGTVLPPHDGGAAVAPATERYEALRTLGAGGMGEVALVHDRDIGRTVAVKRPLGALDGEGLSRFAREVRTIGKLEHPGIVPIHDVGLDADGRHYFVMKYVEGETLGHIIKQLAADDPAYVHRWTFEARCQLFMQLLHAVRYAHAQDILHRDIKPENIMVGPFGEVVLMDWGIARHLDGDAATDPAQTIGGPRVPAEASASSTTEGAILGTPLYMSPEQARGENAALDQRSDLYSLCAVFYELLVREHYLGRPRTGAATVAAILHDPEPTAAEWFALGGRAQVPPELIHFLRKGLHKDRAQRYQSVEEMLEVLGAVRDQRPLVQCHLTFMKRASGMFNHALDRHPALMTAASAMFVLGTLAAAWLGVAAALHR